MCKIRHTETGKVFDKVHVQLLRKFQGTSTEHDEEEPEQDMEDMPTQDIVLTPKGLLKEGNMVIFKDKQTNLVYVAEITYVEQDTETMGVHYYLHDVKAKETFSLDTPLRDRKNFAPEYCRTQRTGKRTREFSIPTFNPRQGDEAVQMDIKYTAGSDANRATDAQSPATSPIGGTGCATP